jgi:hypothetical protein
MDMQEVEAIEERQLKEREAAERRALEERRKSVASREKAEQMRVKRELDEAHSFLAAAETAYEALKSFGSDALVRCGAPRSAPSEARGGDFAIAYPASTALPAMLERALKAARRRLATLEGSHVPKFPEAAVDHLDM